MECEGIYIALGHDDGKEELMFLQSSDDSLNYGNALHCIKEN